MSTKILVSCLATSKQTAQPWCKSEGKLGKSSKAMPLRNEPLSLARSPSSQKFQLQDEFQKKVFERLPAEIVHRYIMFHIVAMFRTVCAPATPLKALHGSMGLPGTKAPEISGMFAKGQRWPKYRNEKHGMKQARLPLPPTNQLEAVAE